MSASYIARHARSDWSSSRSPSLVRACDCDWRCKLRQPSTFDIRTRTDRPASRVQPGAGSSRVSSARFSRDRRKPCGRTCRRHTPGFMDDVGCQRGNRGSRTGPRCKSRHRGNSSESALASWLREHSGVGSGEGRVPSAVGLYAGGRIARHQQRRDRRGSRGAHR